MARKSKQTITSLQGFQLAMWEDLHSASKNVVRLHAAAVTTKENCTVMFLPNRKIDSVYPHIGVTRRGTVELLINIAGTLYAPLFGTEAPEWGREVHLWPVVPIGQWDGPTRWHPRTKAEDRGAGPAQRVVIFEGHEYVIGMQMGLRLLDEGRAAYLREKAQRKPDLEFARMHAEVMKQFNREYGNQECA